MQAASAAARTEEVARSRPARYRVLLLGADRPLGRAVMWQLAGAGHALTPVAAGRPGWRADGTVPLVTIADAAQLREAVAAHDLVCNMMPVVSGPHGPLGHVLRRPGRRRRSALLSWLRTALEAEPSIALIQRSTAMLYHDGGSAWITEAWPVSPVPLTDHTAQAEETAAAHAARSGTAVILRLGHLYGPGDPWTSTLMTLARRGWQPLPWQDSAYFPMLHLHDAARACIAAVQLPGGTYNFADTRPLTVQQLHATLSATVGRPCLYPLDDPVRLPYRELLARSCRLSPVAFTQRTGWRPAVPDASVGLASLPGQHSGLRAGTGPSQGPRPGRRPDQGGGREVRQQRQRHRRHLQRSPRLSPGRREERRARHRPGLLREQRPPHALPLVLPVRPVRRLRRRRGQLQDRRRPAAQAVRHALDRPRRRRHHRPALSRGQQHLGSHLQHPAHSDEHRLTRHTPKMILLTYKIVVHPPRSGVRHIRRGPTSGLVIT